MKVKADKKLLLIKPKQSSSWIWIDQGGTGVSPTRTRRGRRCGSHRSGEGKSGNGG